MIHSYTPSPLVTYNDLLQLLKDYGVTRSKVTELKKAWGYRVQYFPYPDKELEVVIERWKVVGQMVEFLPLEWWACRLKKHQFIGKWGS